MEYIVDRIEGDFAICEMSDKTMAEIQLNLLPENIKEGDIIINENGMFRIDISKTRTRKEFILKKMNSLWK